MTSKRSGFIALAYAFTVVLAQTCPPQIFCPVTYSDAKLPDPFTFFGGSPVQTKADWACRAAEIDALFQKDELGAIPGPPTTLTASYSNKVLTITVSNGGTSISFAPTITYPTTGSAPYPAIIAYDGGSIPIPNTVATINFNIDEFAQQNDGTSRGVGKFYTLFGSNASAGAMAAWAWGVSRIIDALQITPSANINLSKIGVTGCSRNGKGAFVAGAFDSRIALTIPQESGSGGAACWRISDWQLAQGTNVQTAHEIVTENVWFSTLFNPFVNVIPTLPFDHHLLAGLVAPRGLFVIENTEYDWLGSQSTNGCMRAGQEVYKALGAADSMGFSQIGNHPHCQFPSSQQGNLTNFINKFLLGQNTNTNIIVSDGSFTFNKAQWIDWTTPTLS
ncbi:hypothetical protein SISNIDRAFT_477393 [Sistotremastrum niveocremeum HHB9708]|uniref:(4-O-methyl)-D-glucuronate--lignin esterase n=1 Tax=Sistotremastrum niveocremeum HHB9708 TaxID=1314777 RepID=A0A164YMW6_9AGAM|nr:hypothetical protein SISNIDRAFT_477393 [Sistotremastrum niveocremeum HHB9708]